MSLGVGAYKFGGAGQCSSMRRRYPWQPCERAPPAPSHCTIQWNTYRPILTWPIPQEGGRDGKKPKHQMVRKEQAIATTLCKELQASNWVYKQGCALRKIEGSPVLWNCKIQGAQHMICMKNLRFPSRPRAKVRRQGPPGSARAQPWHKSWGAPARGIGLPLV